MKNPAAGDYLQSQRPARAAKSELWAALDQPQFSVSPRPVKERVEKYCPAADTKPQTPCRCCCDDLADASQNLMLGLILLSLGGWI